MGDCLAIWEAYQITSPEISFMGPIMGIQSRKTPVIADCVTTSSLKHSTTFAHFWDAIHCNIHHGFNSSFSRIKRNPPIAQYLLILEMLMSKYVNYLNVMVSPPGGWVKVLLTFTMPGSHKELQDVRNPRAGFCNH